MRHLLAIIFAATSLCMANDFPSPNKFFAVRVDANGARLVQLSTGKTLRTIATLEDVKDDDGWRFSEARWSPRGLCVVILGQWGNHHRYQTLSVWRFSKYSENANVEELDLQAPFNRILPKDMNRDPEARYSVAEVGFGYGDASLFVNYRQIGTGSSQWANERDGDYYTCDFTFEDNKPLELVEFKRVRTTVIGIN